MELDLPPGVIKTQSESAAFGRYVDTEWVRFVSGKPEKIGGWEKQFPTQLNGVPRGLHGYLGADGFGRLGVGTQLKLYSITNDGVVTDITPERQVSALTNPFTTVSGSAEVTVTHALHGALAGDTVYISGGSAVGGITLAGAYTVQTPTTNTFKITHSAAATSSTTGGGSATITYEINIGLVSGADSNGYGTGNYGEETYGTPRTLNLLVTDPRYWSLDNYGNLLIGAYTYGSIYWFNNLTDVKAEKLTGAPDDVIFMFVTEERFVMALCEGMRVQWPDQDNPEDWTPTTTNTANTRRLAAGSRLVGGTKLSQNLALIWTDTSLYLMQYTGGQFVFDSRLVGRNCGLIGPAAFLTVDSIAMWMSPAGFHSYSGFVQQMPRSSEISNWVFGEGNINLTHGIKTVAFYNPAFREAWWIFAAGESLEPNRYVMCCLDDFSWANGSLERVGHAAGVSTDNSPIMASYEGYIYRHEVGKNADGAALAYRLKTGMIRVANGATILDIQGFSPDMDRLEGTALLTVTGRDRPNSTDLDIETVTFNGSSEMVDIRVAGRHIEFEISQNEVDGDFRLGVPFIEDGAGGARR